MAARKSITLNQRDVGVVIEATLVFTDFDPTGAEAILQQPIFGKPGRQMTLVGNVASYMTVANDFDPGYLDAQIFVRKNDVTIASEIFTIIVV